LPRRGYATETSTQGSEGGPPPGFNINEAKKPLPKEEIKAASAPSVAELKKTEQTSVSQTAATAVDKSTANENASLSELAAEKAAEDAKKDPKALAKPEDKKKLTIGQKIMKELHHYWDGTKLLATEVRISSKLALKMAAGYELSRREHRQVNTNSPLLPTILTTSSYNAQSRI
jgi:LETM1 and EF-hand domain-containing protein 1, mitochondrial